MNKSGCRVGVLVFALVNAWLPAAPAPAAESFEIAADGQALAHIVLPAEPLPQTRQAAADLAFFLERITGASFEITSSVNRSGNRIWIGYNPEFDRFFQDTDFQMPGEDRIRREIHIVIKGENLAIVGRAAGLNPGTRAESGAATAHGVYAFLHDHLGVRFLWPGPVGQVVPAHKTLSLDPIDYHYRPPLRQRQLRMEPFTRVCQQLHDENRPDFVDAQTLRRKDTEMMAWRRFHCLEYGNPRRPNWFKATHAFSAWPARYAAEHPDIFARHLDGTRTTAGHTTKLCVTHPTVPDLWIAEVKKELAKNPDEVMFSASPTDGANHNYCTCEKCLALDPEQGPRVTLHSKGQTYESVALTDRYVYFWNRLGERLKAEFPGRELMVGAWAYGAYTTPPVERRLHDNVGIGFVGNLSVNTQEGRERNRQQWLEWSRKASLMVWRPNLFHYGLAYFEPLLITRRLGEDMRFLAENGMVGIDVDSIHQYWSIQGPSYYFLARLAWDPYADVEALRQDYYEKGFGPAARQISQYYDLLETLTSKKLEAFQGLSRGQRIRRQAEIYDEAFLAAAGNLLEDAAKAASSADPACQARVRFVRQGFDFVTAQRRQIETKNAFYAALGAEDRYARLEQAQDAYRDKMAVLKDCFDGFAISPCQYIYWVQKRRLGAALGPLGDAELGLLEHKEDVSPLPLFWDFRLDPDNIGTDSGWQRETGGEDWDSIRINEWWGGQIEQGRYHGIAWYRTTFVPPQLGPGQKLWLEFGAVDESCWVFVNGVLMGAQEFDAAVDPKAWEKPRRFELTNLVDDVANLLTVKVRALAGQGGIYRGALLRVTGTNLIPNGKFARGLESWRLRDSAFHSSAPEGGKHEISLDLGRFVEEKALKIVNRPDDPPNLWAGVGTSFGPGKYRWRLRYRLDGAAYPVARLAFHRQEGKPKNVWKSVADKSAQTWIESASTFDLTARYDRLGLTLFIQGGEGSCWIDEVWLEKLGTLD